MYTLAQLDERLWATIGPCCRGTTCTADLCTRCKSAFMRENERQLRELPDDNREYRSGLDHACGYHD
jgi:hypothetical protein